MRDGSSTIGPAIRIAKDMDEPSARGKAESSPPDDLRPKIYRAMKPDGSRPMLGPGATTLGVRVPGTSAHPDIPPDPAGNVRPGTGGMSVAPSLVALPPHRIPRRLRHLAPKAAAPNTLRIWRLGSGPFLPAPVAAGLRLRPDPRDARHGFVEPDAVMGLDSYQDALAATQDDGSIDEA